MNKYINNLRTKKKSFACVKVKCCTRALILNAYLFKHYLPCEVPVKNLIY